MTSKLKIKIIKKGEKAAKVPQENEVRRGRAAARKVVSNVSGWVQDLQTKKNSAAKLAFENLFGPRPSES